MKIGPFSIPKFNMAINVNTSTQDDNMFILPKTSVAQFILKKKHAQKLSEYY